MRISGRDFMEWFDAWTLDPASKGFVWETDNSVARLHDDKGRWMLDPERIFQLDELGEIQTENLSSRDIDTEAVVGRWLSMRGMERLVIDVPVDDLPSVLAQIDVLSGRLPQNDDPRKMLGVEIVDFLDNGLPASVTVETGIVQDDDGRWTIEMDRSYVPSDLVEVEEGPSLDELLRDWRSNRRTVRVLVDMPDDISHLFRLSLESAGRTLTR